MQLWWTAQWTVPGYGHCQKVPTACIVLSFFTVASVLLVKHAPCNSASTMQLSSAGRSRRVSRLSSQLTEGKELQYFPRAACGSSSIHLFSLGLQQCCTAGKKHAEFPARSRRLTPRLAWGDGTSLHQNGSLFNTMDPFIAHLVVKLFTAASFSIFCKAGSFD